MSAAKPTTYARSGCQGVMNSSRRSLWGVKQPASNSEQRNATVAWTSCAQQCLRLLWHIQQHCAVCGTCPAGTSLCSPHGWHHCCSPAPDVHPGGDRSCNTVCSVRLDNVLDTVRAVGQVQHNARHHCCHLAITVTVRFNLFWSDMCVLEALDRFGRPSQCLVTHVLTLYGLLLVGGPLPPLSPGWCASGCE